MHRPALLAIALLGLAACGSADSSLSDGETEASHAVTDDALEEAEEIPEDEGALGGASFAKREEFDEDAAREHARGEVASEAYDGPCTTD